MWSEVAGGIEIVEFAILATEIVAVRKVQRRFGEAQADAQEADIGEIDFGVEKRGLGGGERESKVDVRDFIETGQGFINERGLGIQVGEVGVGLYACRRLQEASEAEREGVFQLVDASGFFNGGIEACELLLERVCVCLAGKERGGVEEIQRGIIRRRLQSRLEGFVGGFETCRRLQGESGASGCKISLGARELRCREDKNQGGK